MLDCGARSSWTRAKPHAGDMSFNDGRQVLACWWNTVTGWTRTIKALLASDMCNSAACMFGGGGDTPTEVAWG
jgi:hypothetical protein